MSQAVMTARFFHAAYDLVAMAVCHGEGDSLTVHEVRSMRREASSVVADSRRRREALDTSAVWVRADIETVEAVMEAVQAGEMSEAPAGLSISSYEVYDAFKSRKETRYKDSMGRYGWLVRGIAQRIDGIDTDSRLHWSDRLGLWKAHGPHWDRITLEALLAAAKARLASVEADLARADAALAIDYASMGREALVAVAADKSRWWMDRRLAAAAIAALPA